MRIPTPPEATAPVSGAETKGGGREAADLSGVRLQPLSGGPFRDDPPSFAVSFDPQIAAAAEDADDPPSHSPARRQEQERLDAEQRRGASRARGDRARPPRAAYASPPGDLPDD